MAGGESTGRMGRRGGGMRKAISGCMMALGLWLVPAAAVCAELEVVAMDPSGGRLPPGEALYLRVQYRSEVPVRVTARGLRDGNDVPGMTNASGLYRAGEGEVLAWIAYGEFAAVDAVRVSMFDGERRALAVETVPVRVEWDSAASPRTEPAWVAATRVAQADRVVPQPPPSASEMAGTLLFGLAMQAAVLGYLLLQALLPLLWRGGWRRAALVPLLATVPAVVVSVFALLSGSNLWPLWFLLASPLGFTYLLALCLLRWRARRTSAETG